MHLQDERNSIMDAVNLFSLDKWALADDGQVFMVEANTDVMKAISGHIARGGVLLDESSGKDGSTTRR
jgi:hypothetical protein